MSVRCARYFHTAAAKKTDAMDMALPHLRKVPGSGTASCLAISYQLPPKPELGFNGY